MIILDTNVVSDTFQPRPNEIVRSWLDSFPHEDLFICAPVLAEMRFGIERLPAGRRRNDLERLVTHAETRLFESRVLAFDRECAHEFGRIVAKRMEAGRPIMPMDALIASIAVANKMAIATRDIADFSGLEIELINPFDQPDLR